MHHNPIDLYNLSYTYPDGTEALQGICLAIHAAERVALVGANGSGKSTLLMHLNGLLLPQVGQILIGDLAVEAEHLKQIRNFVGLIFQNPEDQLFMPTVWEDVIFGPLNQGVADTEVSDRAKAALAAVGLDPTQFAPRNTHALSGGQKKRVAIAGVLAMQPQVLLLDEPSAQLDPRSRRQLIQLLASLPQTQIIATHDLDLALELCDRAIVLNQGRVVYDGAIDSVMADTDLLERHGLEPPLSYSRPYCQINHAPAADLQASADLLSPIVPASSLRDLPS